MESTAGPSQIGGEENELDGELDDFKSFGSGLDEYQISHKEIERNRIISIDGNGNERISTDEYTRETLEYAHHENSTFLHDEPHFKHVTHGKEKRTIFGRDNRYHRTHSSAPYSAIGYLSPRACSAYLVGPYHLITAAHCVHPRGNRRAIYRASQLTFYLGQNCNTRGTAYTISEVLVYSSYKTYGDLSYDIAFLRLSARAPVWMGFAYRDPMPRVSGEACGYPYDRHDRYGCFYCSRCRDVEIDRFGWWGWVVNTYRLQYTCDTVGGMSGAPIITDGHDSTSNLYSYGVHTHSTQDENQGVRINVVFFYDICRWKCDTGSRCSALCHI